MTAKILIVEDEEALVTLITYNLEAAGYHVETASTSDDAMYILKDSTPDLVILDWMLPGGSGIEICRQIRSNASTRTLPVIMLTARGEEADKLRGLATGADDYMVKPFSVAELMARVKGLLRRSAPEKTVDVLQKGGLSIDRRAHRVTRGTREIALGPTEYRLLEFFMQSAGRVLSRSQLLDNVWGHTTDVDERTVDVHVGRLRKSIVRGAEIDPIRTVRGAGYVYDDKPLGV